MTNSSMCSNKSPVGQPAAKKQMRCVSCVCNTAWALALGSSVLCLPVAHAEVISATPSRPTVSSSAQLSAPGLFELETGYQKIKGSEGDSRTSFPTRLKYSFSESVGLLLDHEMAVTQQDPGGKLRGAGDSALTVKLKFPTAAKDAAAFGLEASVIAPTARDGLGADKAAYSLNGIFSTALGEFSADLNLGVIHQLGVGSGEGHNGWHWATSVAHALNDNWGVVGEFSGAGRRGTATQTQFLAALTYNVSPRMVLDAGMARGINQAAPDWAAFSGITVLLR